MKNLKRPDLKVPPFLSDLFYDLRERHLLPLVALLLVAIVAAPILLSQSESNETKPPPNPAPGGSESGSAQAALAVVRAAPGLREPSKRLKRRKPRDPFKPKFVNRPLGESTVTTTETPATTETPKSGGEGSGGSEEAGGTPPAGGAESGKPNLTYYTTAAKIKIVRSETKPDGKTVHDPPIIRPRVLPATTLLGEKTQIVTYMGLVPKSMHPGFLISSKVTGVFGEGQCIAGTETCQLIELKINEPEVFVYGPNEVRYRIVVLSTEAVVTDHPGNAEVPSHP
jgi:hypothetical protein